MIVACSLAPRLQSFDGSRSHCGAGGKEKAVSVKIQFVPVGRRRREWMWKARDESNTITISGYRLDSLSEALRDAREQIDGVEGSYGSDDDDLFAA